MFIPKELNFFDTNPLDFLLEENPSGIETFMFLCVSKCYKATSTERKPLLLFALPFVWLNAKLPVRTAVSP